MNVLKKFLQSFPKKRRGRFLLILASVSVMLLPLFMSSCGDYYEYDSASERDPKISVLISASELNKWVEDGYPGDKYGHNKVVVLHVGEATGYSSHVPGAYLVDANDLKDFNTGFTRSDGVSNIESMVAIKSTMDKLIKKAGIDGSSVIVLTSNKSDFELLSRVYFNFRYWGFPRSKLRVLDGFVDTTWVDPDAGYSTESAAPKTPEATEYSVCNLTQEPDRFRVSLEEMIKVAKDDNPKTVVIDTRSADEYNGLLGRTEVKPSEYVAFEGHIKSALWQEYTQLLKADGTLLDKEPIDELSPMFSTSALGLLVDDTTTAYVYGSDGQSASITFLALDGVLNYPVRVYDGGWLEWGQMAGGDNGDLDADSKWRTEDPNSPLSAAVTFNATVKPLSSYSFVDSDAKHANAVNEEDRVICFEGGGGDAGGY